MTDEQYLSAIKRHWRKLNEYAIWYSSGDRQEAEELFQDTMLKMWELRGRYNSAKGSVKTWGVTIMRSAAHTRRSYSGAQMRTGIENQADLIHLEAPPFPEDALLSVISLEAAVRGLPAKLRAVIDLMSQDLTCREIGAVLGLTPQAVYQRMRKIIDKVGKQCL